MKRRSGMYVVCAWMALASALFKPAAAAAEFSFGFRDVVELAKKISREPFKAPEKIPGFLTNISYDEYRDIRFDPARTLWNPGKGNFQVQLLHPGLFYNYPVIVNVCDAEGVSRVPFSTEMFDYGRNKFKQKIPPDLGFAGFRLHYPLYSREQYNHVLVFAGASYFRGVGKNQVFGLSARGLAIDTGLPSGEEFPLFREFWLERPAAQASAMKVYALLDSPSIAGAYQLTVHPGERTVVEVRAELFERKRVKELGIAPLTSMFFYGEEKGRPKEEWRPEVHDSDGLLIAAGEWIWRPLVNPERLRVSYFEIDNPRGFGLLQRDRAFHSYEDLEARYDLRPNGWVTPIGDWGKGQIKLVQIPTKSEFNDNIVAYWIPKNLPKVGEAIRIAYRIAFQAKDPLDAHAGRVVSTRIGDGDKADATRFILDFDGENLRALPADAPLKARITVGGEGKLVQHNVLKNPVTGSWRLAFQVLHPKNRPLELRAFLQHENDAMTETWSYLVEP